MVQRTSYGTLAVAAPATIRTDSSDSTPEKNGAARRRAGTIAMVVGMVSLLGCATVLASPHLDGFTSLSTAAPAAVMDQADIPDCQCLGICNTPDAGHAGTWCYINSEISPCLDSTRRSIYGQSWARCEVIYGDNDCAGDPCQNSAICVDKYDGFECVCRPGWSGTNCDTRVNVEYTIRLTTSDAADSGTQDAIFFLFQGTEGDTTIETMVFVDGIGQATRPDDVDCPGDNPDMGGGYKTATVVAADIGQLHKVSYRVGGDDSMDPSKIEVEFKGDVFVAVGDLPASEYSTPVSVSMVQGREYSLYMKVVDSPNWASTTNDVYVQLTGADWQVSGAVVVFPTGINDGAECTTTFYAADVGAPAKITYWVRDDNTLLPSTILVDGRYRAQVTTGTRYYDEQFIGDADTGSGYGFNDTSCAAGDETNGCSGVAGVRWCVLLDPDVSQNEVLCPWVLPYSDGRYIIIDLTDEGDGTPSCPNTNATAVAAAKCNCSDAVCTVGQTCQATGEGLCASPPDCADPNNATPSDVPVCTCANAFCSETQTCNAGTSACTWPTCPDGTAFTASAMCSCGADGNDCAQGGTCDVASSTCTLPACGNTDATAVNTNSCMCGTSTCSSNSVCTASSNTCANAPAACGNTDATEANTDACTCGTTALCGASNWCTAATPACAPSCNNDAGGATEGCVCAAGTTCTAGQTCGTDGACS